MATTGLNAAQRGRQPRFVLASSSPRRRELLERIGLTFDVVAADIDESPFEAESPPRYVARLALAKALGVPREPGVIVIAADTTIDLDGTILGKPTDRADAVRMLRRLAGRRHLVHTAVALRYDASDRSGIVSSADASERGASERATNSGLRDRGTLQDEQHDVDVATTAVDMVPYDRRRIEWYVASGEPLDKAGAYAIQGRGDVLVASIEGNVSNVVGLPLTTLMTMLEVGPGWTPLHGPVSAN